MTDFEKARDEKAEGFGGGWGQLPDDHLKTGANWARDYFKDVIERHTGIILHAQKIISDVKTKLKTRDAVIEKLRKTLEFYAKAPCHPKIIKIAPRFREPAKKALKETNQMMKEG